MTHDPNEVDLFSTLLFLVILALGLLAVYGMVSDVAEFLWRKP